MNYKKTEYMFIKTSDKETADKLRTLGFTEITESGSDTFCFLNDAQKLTFDAEQYNAVYSNVLCM